MAQADSSVIVSGTCARARPPSRIQLKPTVSLNIESGRVAMTVEAEIAELSGHVLQLDVSLPENFLIVEVSGDGLTGWRAGSDRQLRLMFDGRVARPKRLVRVVGWMPLSDDPFKVGPHERRLATPWIRRRRDRIRHGVLDDLIGLENLAAWGGGLDLDLFGIGAGRRVDTSQAALFLSSGRSAEARRNRLGINRARVNVAIESQLTLYPDSAEWVAVLRYDVSGGALDAIHLRMPAAWSAAAEFHFTGGEYQLTKETRGQSSFWTITPKHPIWGSERLVLRSTVPLSV